MKFLKRQTFFIMGFIYIKFLLELSILGNNQPLTLGAYVMAGCEFIEKCIFFHDQMDVMPSAAYIFKQVYCKGDNIGCARYIVAAALGREKVPRDLFPNMSEHAREIIAASAER
ncbi:MAG TPA: hypothetical protein VGK02_11455 [Candidatus Aquicultor sp.]